MQYQYLDDYLYYFTDQPNNMITAVSKSLMFSGFSFDLKSNNVMLANGFTNAKQNTASYLKALQKSGKGKRSIAKIAPKRTALYMSYAFDSFLEFYENFEIIQRENKAQFKTFQDNKDKIENYLKINIKDHFLSWIGTEIAVLQIQSSSISKSKNDVALVIKANNIKDAKSNLDFIVKQIRKRTPVKFKAINYKGFDINFLSIKGFFKVFLGSLFDQFEKPYYTIIDDYVVFSNHPNALKSIINDYIGEETLNKSKDFQKFNSYFDKKSSVFAYINTPVLYKNLYEYADRNTKSKIKKNKDYIICFPQVGFQLTPYINMFESKFVVNYIDPEVVKNKDQFKDLPIIGPTNDSNNNDNTNILEIEQRDIFNIRDIYPSDLNAKEYIKKFKNGKVRMKISLKNGQKNGAYREYHLNGEVKIKGRYKKDQQVGTWKAYDINGDLIKKKRF
jgi:antitoxin component YwqK of YwqJK toxin-antitoxin module